MRTIIIFVITLMLTKSINCFSQLKPEEIRFDQTITGFKYATKLDDMVVYLPNGKPDLNSKKSLSTFSLRPKYNMNYESAKGYLNFLKSYEERNGGTITNVKTRDTVINNNRVFELTMYETFKGNTEKAHHFYAFILKSDTAIIFLSSDLTKDTYFSKFKKTFYTIKF